jgi:hypothetical protein
VTAGVDPLFLFPFLFFSFFFGLCRHTIRDMDKEDMQPQDLSYNQFSIESPSGAGKGQARRPCGRTTSNAAKQEEFTDSTFEEG